MTAYTYEMIKENEYLPAFFRTVDTTSMTVPAHWHNYLEIVYLISGKMTAIIQAETYELVPGDLLIINSEDIHMTQTHGEETTYHLLQISAAQLRYFFPNFHLLRFETVISHLQKSETSSLSVHEDYFHMIHSIFQKKEDGYPLLFTAKLHEFLYYLYRNHSSWLMEKENDKNFAQIHKTIEWIHNHYQEPLTLANAASYLGFTREYFCRFFKKYTGQTFLEYVGNIRAMKFYEDLKESDKSITYLMEKHGITNYKVFLQTFKKLYGNTPQKIRHK